jgi:hypothetical protein
MRCRFAFFYPLCVVTALPRKLNRVLTLGIPKLDEVFPGFEGGDFVVLAGRALGLMLSFLLSVRCQLPLRKGGLNSRAVFIDGGNTFDPYTVSAMAREFDLEPRSVLEKILVSRAFTAYQLTELVFEKLEAALKKSRSKFMVISAITGLFLDRDMPKIEGRHIFLKITRYLSELASRRRAIVVASYFSRPYSRRNFFLESVLFERASTVVRLKESEGGFKFTLEDHPSTKPFAIDVPSNKVTIDMFAEN